MTDFGDGFRVISLKHGHDRWRTGRRDGEGGKIKVAKAGLLYAVRKSQIT